MLKFIASTGGAFIAARFLPAPISTPLLTFLGIYSAYKGQKELSIGTTVGAISAMLIPVAVEAPKEQIPLGELEELALNNAFIYVQRNGNFTEGILIAKPVILDGKIAITNSPEFNPILRIDHDSFGVGIAPNQTELEVAKNAVTPFLGKMVIMVHPSVTKPFLVGPEEKKRLLSSLTSQGVQFTEFTKKVPELVRVDASPVNANTIEGETATKIANTIIAPTIQELAAGRKILYLKSNPLVRNLFLINDPFFTDGKLIMDSSSPLLLTYSSFSAGPDTKQLDLARKNAGDGKFLLVFDNSVSTTERDFLRKGLFNRGLNLVQFHGTTPEVVSETTFEDFATV